MYYLLSKSKLTDSKKNIFFKPTKNFAMQEKISAAVAQMGILSPATGNIYIYIYFHTYLYIFIYIPEIYVYIFFLCINICIYIMKIYFFPDGRKTGNIHQTGIFLMFKPKTPMMPENIYVQYLAKENNSLQQWQNFLYFLSADLDNKEYINMKHKHY